jgi:SH3-like domain-containing protein
MKYFIFISILWFYSFESYSQVCTLRNHVELKQESNLNSETTWIVGKYMPFKVIETKGNWLKLADVDGVLHWGLKKNFTSKQTCLVVVRKNIRLRNGPGTRFPAAEFEIADKYSPFKDLGGEDGWTMVEDDFGNRGYVPLNTTWKPTAKVSISY